VTHGELTWLGHSTFRVDTPGNKRVYVDPWLTGNPKCPESEQSPERVDIIALTHGHSDHVGDAVRLAKEFQPEIVAQVELKAWLGRQGAPVGALPGINKGGSQDVGGVRFTLTNAFHSSSAPDGSYLGEAAGIVIKLESGRSVYFAGDTCVFGDMALIKRLYQPDLVVLPIGDRFTMGPDEAALALELLGAKRCFPCHFGTFGLLTGTTNALRKAAPDVEVIDAQPGVTVSL
jgi:L-ascorbate metabolism protein UlaG (beta-lactamase superfamily)